RDAGAEHHIGAGQFTADLVGYRADGNHGHRGMGGDHALYLGRVDVEPAGDDQVLLAVDDEVVAFVVTGGDVAGVQPAAGLDRGACRLVIAVVAEHDQRAADHQFARLAVGYRDARIVECGNPGLQPGKREADLAMNVGHVTAVA